MIDPIEFEDLVEYKAAYMKRPPENLKKYKCIVPISVGQTQHEGTKFKAALKLISNTFKECIIVVCDSLQKYTLAVHNHGMTEEALYKLSLEHGDNWLRRNQGAISKLDIPYQILRWDYWLDMPEYIQYREKVDTLYDTNATCREAFDETANVFITNLGKKHKILDLQRAINLSLEYLKEESALVCLWSYFGHRLFVYPGTNKALAASIKTLEIDIMWLQYSLRSIPNTALSFQSIIDASLANLYWKNLKGAYIGCNKALLQYLNMSNPEELIGKTDFDIHDYDVAKPLQVIDVDIIKNGVPKIIKEKDEKTGTVFLSHKAPLRNHDNEIIGIIGTSIDITAQDKAEQKLKQQTQDLAASLESKDRFLRNMSHEMRIPLQAMLGIPQELRAQYDRLTDQQKKEYLDIAISAGDRFMSLISNLLDLSKFKEGKFIMEFKKENIKSLVEGVVNEFKYMHGNITVMVCEDVPQYLVCDAFRVSQVIRNLIGNSIKHGGKDRPIHIALSTQNERNKLFVKCTVKDEGVGIPDKEKEAIFDAFSESTRTRTNAGGTGLGLTISREIALAHKGDIWVGDLEKGETGARIHFTLSTSIVETVNASMKESA